MHRSPDIRRGSRHALVSLALLAVPLSAVGCEKKQVPATPPSTAAVDPGPPVGFVDPTTPTTTSTLTPGSGAVAAQAGGASGGATGEERLNKLRDRLQSPCGKAQSLRASLADPTCKRAPFADRWMARATTLTSNDDDIKEVYDKRYLSAPVAPFDLSSTPSDGPPNAPIVFVEFFDYRCPHCATASPVLSRLVKQYPGQVVVYFKNFPLGASWEGSASAQAAAAALAAHRQGKFSEMHTKLFENQGAFSRDQLMSYARELGLDMQRFAADLEGGQIRGQIRRDRLEGERVQVAATPALYVNGRMYVDNVGDKELAAWIEEEQAVNR